MTLGGMLTEVRFWEANSLFLISIAKCGITRCLVPSGLVVMIGSVIVGSVIDGSAITESSDGSAISVSVIVGNNSVELDISPHENRMAAIRIRKPQKFWGVPKVLCLFGAEPGRIWK